MNYREAMWAFQRALLGAALDEADGVRAVAAESLGMSRTYYLRLLNTHAVARSPGIVGDNRRAAAARRARKKTSEP